VSQVVLDTCALLFWTLEPRRLSAPATAALDALTTAEPGVLSAASAWEIALKQRRGLLDLGCSLDDFLTGVHRLPLQFEPVGVAHWVDSVRMPWEHRDPVDRLVVALAQRLHLPLVTADRTIRRAHGECIW